MPPWNQDELLALLDVSKFPANKGINPEQVKKLHATVEGNVRLCVNQLRTGDSSGFGELARKVSVDSAPVDVPVSPFARVLQDLDAAVENCDTDLLLQYIGRRDALSDKLDRLSHTLITLKPSADFRAFSYAFCGAEFRERLMAKNASAALVRTLVSFYLG